MASGPGGRVRDDALGAGEAELGVVVGGVVLVAAVVDDVVTGPRPVILESVLKLEPGMVGTDVNTHGRIVPHANRRMRIRACTDVRMRRH